MVVFVQAKFFLMRDSCWHEQNAGVLRFAQNDGVEVNRGVAVNGGGEAIMAVLCRM